MKLTQQAKLASVFTEMAEDNNLIICGRARDDADGTFVMIGGRGDDVMAMTCQVASSIYIRYKVDLKAGVGIEDFAEDIKQGILTAYEGMKERDSYSDYGAMMENGGE